MNSTGSIFNIWGLERNQIFTDLSYCVLGRRILLPRLTHGLERSLSASVFDQISV